MKLNTFDKNEPEQTKNRPSEVKCPIQEFYYGGVVYDLETMPIDKIKDDCLALKIVEYKTTIKDVRHQRKIRVTSVSIPKLSRPQKPCQFGTQDPSSG